MAKKNEKAPNAVDIDLRGGPRDGEGILTIGMTGPSLSSGINNVGLNALVHVMADDIRVQEDLHLMVAHAVVRQMQQGE